MKNLYLLSFFLLFTILFSCSKEEQVCVKSDFIGDFLGGTICKSNGATGSSVATLIRVTDGNAENEVIIDVSGFKIAVVIDGCSFTGSDKNADVDITFSGSLSGENIKVKLSGTAFNTPLDCESQGEKN